jgi:flagellar assembly factor FliW
VPFAPFPDYDFEIDEQGLGIEDPEDVTVLTIVTVRREGGVAEMSTNLRAPLIIDRLNRRLHQVILPDSTWPVRARFAELVSNGGR